MMLQNESADDDIEHFEDIVEEGDNQKTTELMKQRNTVETVATADGTNSDTDSTQDEGGSSTSGSESDVSDEVDDLFIGGDLENVKETKRVPDETKQLPQTSDVTSSLPGGYNPRHREPLYWYFDL